MKLSVFSELLILLAVVLRDGVAVDQDDHRVFADTFTDNLYSKKNECSSTWGVSMLMDLLRPGGSTKLNQEVCDGMALCGGVSLNGLLWEGAVGRLMNKYDGNCMGKQNTNCDGKQLKPTLKVANGVWIDDEDKLKSKYSNIVGNQLQKIDFDDPGAGGKINDWVKDKTKGLIKDIVDDAPIDYDMVAVNSIYLKALWERQFKKYDTNSDLFYTSPSRTTALPQKAHFMHQLGQFEYSNTALPGHQLLKLNYANSVMSMLIALPKKVGTEPPSATDAVAALPSLKNQRVFVALPKFKITSKHETKDLKDAFKAVNITTPFDSGMAGYCGLIDGACMFIEDMIQKILMEVDELGTEAAAVTAAFMTRTMAPPMASEPFMADHQFHIFIYDEEEDLVLFEGRVGEPTPPAGSKTPLQSKHTQKDFWDTLGSAAGSSDRDDGEGNNGVPSSFSKCRKIMAAQKKRCCAKKNVKRRKCFEGIMRRRCKGIYRNRSKGSTRRKFTNFRNKVCKRKKRV